MIIFWKIVIDVCALNWTELKYVLLSWLLSKCLVGQFSSDSPSKYLAPHASSCWKCLNALISPITSLFSSLFDFSFSIQMYTQLTLIFQHLLRPSIRTEHVKARFLGWNILFVDFSIRTLQYSGFTEPVKFPIFHF